MEQKKNNTVEFSDWKINFLNVRVLISPLEYKKFGRNFLTKNWNITNWTLFELLNIIPFLFGVSSVIYSQYKNKSLTVIFGTNLPKIKNEEEKISWETFKFIKLKTLDIKKIKQIDLFPNSCTIKYPKEEKHTLLGIILPTSQTNYFFAKEKYWKIVSDKDFTKKNNFSEVLNIYYNLDEIPIKVSELPIANSLAKGNKNNSIFTTQLEHILQNINEEVDQSTGNKKEIVKKVNIPINFGNNHKNKIKPIVCAGTIPQNLIKNKIILSNEFTEQIVRKKDIFEKEIKILSAIDGIQLHPGNSLVYNTNLFFPFYEYCSNETLQILNDFVKLKQKKIGSIKGIYIRNISGYKYPDMGRGVVYAKKLYLLFDEKEKESTITIEFPINYLTALKNPCLINSNSYNPLVITSRKDNFFGTTELDSTNFTDEASKGKTTLINKNLENILIQEPKKAEIPTVEDLDDSDPDSWFLSFSEKNIKGINFEEIFFLNYLKNQGKDFKWYIDDCFSKDKKINYTTIPFTENFIIEKTTTSQKLGDTYTRIPTLFNFLNDLPGLLQKNNFSFFQSWEPISFNSWMIITQFSVGFILFRILKDLYKDYGKELIDYILQFASSSGIDVETIKEQYFYDDPGYRVLPNVQKRFQDMAGIDNLLLQLGEIVWFLRNGGRSSKLKNSIPKGILLTGPPGTGKTILVQALAGEAKVPILIESGSLLTDPQEKGRGSERLKRVFNQARAFSPCILFIDEIDTLGEKRQNIIKTAMGGDEIIESIYQQTPAETTNSFLPKPISLKEKGIQEKNFDEQLIQEEQKFEEKNGIEQAQETKNNRLNLLTQFLVELDGLKRRQGVIVIGATNRPTILDPALLRPGRFDQIINLNLPKKEKRIEIFKLYSQNIQVENSISWEYLAKRSRGFSAADIAAAMNESTIQAILSKTTHTIETIEKGIDLITSYNSETIQFKTKKQAFDPFFLSRLAYYESGKAIVQSLLVNHPPLVVFHLWSRPKNTRHRKLYENSFSENTNRQTLEARLIGLYGGKASEIIFLYGNKSLTSFKRWQSNLGEEDIRSGTFLANLLVDKWYFYSIEILIQKRNQISNQIQKFEKFEILNQLNTDIDNELEIEKIANLSKLGKYQQRAFGAWWQNQVAKQTSEIESFFGDWFRIYLPNPEENMLNLEWMPPDEYHHGNESLQKLSTKSTISVNDLYQIKRDYIFHGLILTSFNTGITLLEEKREFLDYFADYLLRFEIIRENELKNILKSTKKNKKVPFKTNPSSIVKKWWGNKSRKKTFRIINIAQFQNNNDSLSKNKIQPDKESFLKFRRENS